MLRIITTKRLGELLYREQRFLELEQVAEMSKNKPTYHCGHKGCQFFTYEPAELDAHRKRCE